LQIVRDLVAAKPDAIVLVFTQYRDTVASLVEALSAAGIRCDRLVGQQDRDGKEGQKQSEQADVLARFARREFTVLVSTSIGEEGLDVPQVDLVVFYEAIPSEIRAVQRRGRTGRTVAGRVVVLVTSGTRDEAFLRAQTAREGKMQRLVRRFG
jgi:ERCC4-related helicase